MTSRLVCASWFGTNGAARLDWTNPIDLDQ